METLNTYNFQEEMGLKPLSFNVSISDNDKIIKIEENGDLIAELSFLLNQNILSLIGKDNLEVAQIELPVAMSKIVSQTYNPEDMSIELGIEQTNGKTTTFCLDVKELVDVYTGGDGIDISNNVISIKIKDSETNALSVDSEGLDINLDSINDGIEDLQKEIERVETKVDTVNGRVDLVTSNISTINEALNGIHGNISDINSDLNRIETSTNNLDSRLDATELGLVNEKSERVENDKLLEDRIKSLEDSQGTSEDVKNELKRLDEADKTETARATEKENTLTDELNNTKQSLTELSEKLDIEIGDRGEKDTSLTDDITDINNNLGTLNSDITNLNSKLKEEITRSTTIDEQQKQLIDDSVLGLSNRIDGMFNDVTALTESLSNETKNRENSDKDLSNKIESLTSNLTSLDEKINAETVRATSVENKQKQLIDDSVINLSNADKILTESINSTNDKLSKLELKVNTEIGNRSDEDLSITDDLNEVKVKLSGVNESLANEISRATESENNLLNKINSEETRATNKETELEGLISAEKVRAEGAENGITESLSDEVTRATYSEELITNSLNNEVKRATEKEDDIVESLKTEIADRKSEDIRLTTEFNKKIDDESEIRKNADIQIQQNLENESTERKDSETQLKETITKEYTDLVDTIQLKRSETNNLLYNLLVNGINKGQINIPEDKMLESVSYDEDKKELTFNWNASSQQDPTVINVSDLVDTYTASDGIALDSNKAHNFIIPLSNSNYIKLNDKKEIDVFLSLVKPEGTKWTYNLLDGKGNVNGNTINLNEDVNALKLELDEKFATKNKLDSDLLKTKNDLIGLPSDNGDAITIHGVRNKIAETVEGDVTSKINAAKVEAINTAGINSDTKDTVVLTNAKSYTDGEISKLNTKLTDSNKDLYQKYLDNNVAINNASKQITRLSTGLDEGQYTGGTGVFDELHKLFHQLTRDIDENNMERYLKNLEETLSTVSKNLNTLDKKVNELDLLYWEKFSDEQNK